MGLNCLITCRSRANKQDKIFLYSRDGLAVSALLDILAGERKADSGTFKWGITITMSYFPTDAEKEKFFLTDLNLVDWLRQYSVEKDESFIRGFLGRMLFSGEESLKKATVLSGGEKVRCMLSRMMLSGANMLMLDEPTNHLDLESIESLNNGLIDFKGPILFTSHDHQFVQTVANRIIEITPAGILDKLMTYDEYLTDERVKAQREELYEAVA